MCTLYLDQQGARLGREGYQLTLKDRDGGERRFPIEQVDRVMVYGQVQITTAALGALLSRGIPTTLLSERGWRHGHLVADCGGQVRRRARQYDLMRNPEASLPLAQTLIATKLRNQRWLLRTLAGGAASRGLKVFIKGAEQATSAESLLGIEGSGTAAYFQGFRQLLTDSSFEFNGRNRRPPRDPINSMLSLGYTLLLAELRNAMHGYGLDPFAGVFHASDGSQPSCALDLIEPLRCLVDRLVVRLARHDYAPDDFEVNEDGCFFNNGCRGAFYRAWEELMISRVRWEGENHTYRVIIQRQVGRLANHLDDPTKAFQPLVFSALGR